MAIAATQVEPHWNYLLAIEQDVIRLSRYVEFASSNFSVYSVELARILLAAASEVDVVCKQLCKQLDARSKADNINQYRDAIRPTYPTLNTFEVCIPRYGLQLQPWDAWRTAKGIPDWWSACNKVKHHRHSKYHEANLQNALNAVAGLFVIILYLYKPKAELAELLPNPQLLSVGATHFNGMTHNGMEFGINYAL